MSELKKDSVERTLCIPLWSRAIAVKKLPQILPDHGARAGNAQISMTENDTRMPFAMENAEKELPAYSDRIAAVEQKSYLEGYPAEGVRYNWVTRLYIRSKRDQVFVVRTAFRPA